MGARIHRLRLGTALASLLAAGAAALAAGSPAAGAPSAAFAAGPLPPAGAPLATPRSDAHPYFGYNEDWFSHRGRIGFTARGGADTARVVMSWNRVEPDPGEARWRRYDRLYAQVLESGMRPLWVLADAPCWAQGLERAQCHGRELGFPPAPAHDPDFAAFAYRVAERYPAAIAIEAWNEPNLWSFWRPEPEPARAAVVTAWANWGVKQAAPTMPVIFGGLSPVLVAVEGEQNPYKRFLRRAYAAVGTGHWDGVAIHPFPSFQKSSHYLREVLAHLRRVRNSLPGSARGTPIWVTEIGLSTEGLRPYSPREQAQGLVRIYRGLAAEPDVPAVIVHRVIDQPKSLKTAEAGWGIVRRGGRSKPAYCALAAERGERCRRR